VRRLLRRIQAAIAASLVAIPSHIVVEVAVATAFVFLLLATATPGEHRGTDASAAHFAPERLRTRGDPQPAVCLPDPRGERQGWIAAPPIEAAGTRCRDPRSYV